MILASGSQLAQSRPSGTTAVKAFEADLTTEITLIAICNTTSSTATFSLYHDDDGSTFDQSTALHYSQNIPANTTLYISADAMGGGITVNKDGQIGVQTGTSSALTFTIYGTVQTIAGPG